MHWHNTLHLNQFVYKAFGAAKKCNILRKGEMNGADNFKKLPLNSSGPPAFLESQRSRRNLIPRPSMSISWPSSLIDAGFLLRKGSEHVSISEELKLNTRILCRAASNRIHSVRCCAVMHFSYGYAWILCNFLCLRCSTYPDMLSEGTLRARWSCINQVHSC